MKKGIIVNMDLCVGCQACFVACKQENQVAPKMQWNQIQRTEDAAKGIITYFRMSCMHCEDPACMKVCPVKAVSKGPKGEILVDDKKCIGCRMCQNACPWHVPMFNAEGRTNYWDKAPLVHVEPEPHQKRTPGKAEHCTLCAHRDVPACVEVCKLGALRVVDYDNLSTEDEKLVAASKAMNGAEGTKPKVRFVSENVEPNKLDRRMVHPK